MTKFDPMNPLQDVTPRFTEEQLQIMVQWFDGKAKSILAVDQEEPSHAITVGQLQNFLALRKFHRRSFHYPDYSEIMREMELLGIHTLKLLTKDQFIYLLDKFVLEPEMKHELKLAFKVFDLEQRDFIELEELRHIVTTYGDPLTPVETSEFIREANVRGLGNIYYNDFADDIFNLSPDLYKIIPQKYLYEDADQDPSLPPMPPEAEFEEEIISGPLPSPVSEIPSSPDAEQALGDNLSPKYDSTSQDPSSAVDETPQIPLVLATQTKRKLHRSESIQPALQSI